MTSIGHHHRWSLGRASERSSHDAGLGGARHVVLGLGAAVLLIAAFAHPLERPATALTAGGSSLSSNDEQLRAEARAELHSFEAAITSAQAVWEDSAGRVLDDAPRQELQGAITRAEGLAHEVRTGVVWPGTTLEQTVAADIARLATATAALTTDVTGVDDAVAAWEAEQARLAAEAQAARQAAAAAAAARSHVGSARTTAAGATGIHVESIWTSGGQAQIDACRGAVNVSPVASYLGGGFYAAEHWSCGGSAWGGIGTGALVEFAGYGTYQVAGRIGGLSYGSDASVLPGGYAGYYQTCIGGSSTNMTVWLLTRVG